MRGAHASDALRVGRRLRVLPAVQQCVLGRMVQNASAGVGGGCAVLRRYPRWRQSVQYSSYAAAAPFLRECS